MSTENFKWTDELVRKFAEFYRSNQPVWNKEYWGKDLLEVFKQKNSVDHEILSFTSKEGWIYKKNNLNEYVAERTDCPIHKLILHPENIGDIHSVKRLSDGEIFTVGELTSGGNKIEKFCVSNFVVSVKLSSRSCTFGTNLASLTKQKPQFLFKTEDGVDIYEGMDWWIVGVGEDKWAIDKMSYSKGHVPRPDYTGKRFSSEEKAKEYIVDNNPCLGIKDILSLWCIDSETRISLKEFVRKKLNL